MTREIKLGDLVEVTGRQMPRYLKEYYKKIGLVLNTAHKPYGLRVLNNARVYFDCGDVIEFYRESRPYLDDLTSTSEDYNESR